MVARKRGVLGTSASTVTTSGWIYADLLLALAMLFFAISVPGNAPELATRPTETPTPSPQPGVAQFTATEVPTSTPTVTPTATAQPLLNKTPHEERVALTPGDILGASPDTGRPVDAAARNRVVAQLRQSFDQYDGKSEAAVVLTFGAASTPAAGIDLARRINILLREILPNVFRDDVTAFDNYWLGNTPPVGTVEFKIFFYAGQAPR
jgi:hypothetical protein